MTIYEFQAENGKGETVSLADYKGKALLIINSATQCGFTPQYSELQKLYKEGIDRDFVVLDFPCNQFGSQAPGTSAEIASFCDVKFGVTFPQFGKIDVNGEDAHPLFTYLKGQKGFAGFDPANELTPVLEDMLGKADPNYKASPDIKWNFTKFLVDKQGNVVERFEPTESMETVREKVLAIL